MWELDYKESWVPKNWCFWTVVLEKTLDSQGKRLLCTSVSLLLSHIQDYHYHLSKFHMYALVYCIREKAMAPHSSTLAWKIPWMEEPSRLQSMGSLELDTTEWLHFHFSLSCTGEGNSNPLQRSCLENPRDGGAWWAAVYGVAQSRTQLKRLSSSSSRTTRT